MAQTGSTDDIRLMNGVPATPQITGDWYSGDLEVNPSDNDTVATTGQITTAGWYLVAMRLYASVDSIVEIAHRDADNTADNNTQRVNVASSSGNAEIIFPNKVQVAANERFIARMDGGVTGNVQASIFLTRIIA